MIYYFYMFTRRTATNRAIEGFIEKYPDYKGLVKLDSVSRTVAFQGKRLRWSQTFLPGTERKVVWGWLNECRKADEAIIKRKELKEIEDAQGKLL